MTTSGDTSPTTTSLLPPRLSKGIVERADVEARLGPDTGASWTLVVGPPGAGKTTLVRMWLSRRPDPWAWIAVDRDPSTRAGLAELIVRAVALARRHDTLDVLDNLEMEEVGSDAVLRNVVGDLARTGANDTPAIIVIDDAHDLDAGEWEQLGWLLDHLPSTLHVVLISRVEPPIPLGRQRTSGRMTEVRRAQLAFDLKTIDDLVHRELGIRRRDIAEALLRRTEGWAAGVRLALLAMRNGAVPDELMSRFDGTDASVAEFLLEEVLSHQPPEHRGVLLDAATVGVLDASLCEALTDRDDAAELLETLARDGVFITWVQQRGREYRFHPMLRDLLRYELARLDPARARDLHQRAARWYIGAGRAIDAVEHLLAAGEHEDAHRIVLDNFTTLYAGKQRQHLGRWLTAIPDDIVGDSLDRALDHCEALALLAHEDARRWYARCDQMVPVDDHASRARLLAVSALGHAIAGRLEAMQSAWAEARRQRPHITDEPIDEVISSWEVRLERVLGDPAVAVASGRRLLASNRTLVHDAPALSILAGALDAAGRPAEAIAIAERAITRWRDAGEPELPGMVDALIVRAQGHRLDGDLDEADDLVQLARALTPAVLQPHLLSSLSVIERAEIDRARGNPRWRTELLALVEELRMTGAPEELVLHIESGVTDRTAPGGDAIAHPEHAGATQEDVPEPLVEDLSDRERTVLRFLASHLTFPEIGRELYISRHTVKSHAMSIYRKLGVSSRSDAVRAARHRRLIDG